MKPAEKISFTSSKEYIIRVKYKDVYVGMIIVNSEGMFEWREKGWRVLAACLANEEFPNFKEMKSYLTELYSKREKRNKEFLTSTVKSLTEKGQVFMKKFLNNTPVKSNELISEEKNVADSFVVDCLLEKGTLNGKVVYWSTLKKI